MKKLIGSIVAFMVLLGVPATPAFSAALTYPVQVADPWPVPDAPSPTAPSWLLYDESAGATIAARSPNERRAMASVTKIMTGLLVLEQANMSDEVTVSATAAATGEKEIDLVAGERVTVEQLFKALMIHSANDAATALAEHVAGTVPLFVDMMNDRAASLGLQDTSFANPHGLDAPGHFTSAHDLLVMTEAAMEYPLFAETVRARSYVFPRSPDGTSRIAQSTNLMLGEYEGMSGVKTGFTLDALLTFVASAERDGRVVYAIVLGSDGRRAHFADATLLLDYAFESMPYYQMISSGRSYVSTQPVVDPGPMTLSRDTEALIHIASEGLLLDQPGPIREVDEPEPIPIIETVRQPEAGPESFWDAIGFWFTGS